MLSFLVRPQALGDTGLDVVAHDELADTSELFVDRRDLGQDLEANVALLHHTAQAPDLDFDDAETSEGFLLDLLVNVNRRIHPIFIPYPRRVFELLNARDQSEPEKRRGRRGTHREICSRGVEKLIAIHPRCSQLSPSPIRRNPGRSTLCPLYRCDAACSASQPTRSH